MYIGRTKLFGHHNACEPFDGLMLFKRTTVVKIALKPHLAGKHKASLLVFSPCRRRHCTPNKRARAHSVFPLSVVNYHIIIFYSYFYQ